jgi:myosin-5
MPWGSHRTSRSESLDGTGGTGTSTTGKPSPWEQLLAVLNALRDELMANYVPVFLQRSLFVQLFSFINTQLFNQLLLRSECSSFENGEYLKNGLAQVRLWAKLLSTVLLMLEGKNKRSSIK